MVDELSEDGNWRWDGFDWKPSQPPSRKGPPSKEESLYNKRKLRGGPPSVAESMRNTGQSPAITTRSKSTKPTYSEDGLWMWNGEEWIPSPPSGQPVRDNYSSPSEVNTTRVDSILSEKEQLRIVKNAYESGKKSIKMLLIFLLVSIPTVILFSVLTYDTMIVQEEFFGIINVILVIGYLVVGGLIFASNNDIEKFKILRSQNPLESKLDRGDKGVFMYKSSIYLWAAPFIFIIIAVIVVMFFFSVSAKNNNRKY